MGKRGRGLIVTGGSGVSRRPEENRSKPTHEKRNDAFHDTMECVVAYVFIFFSYCLLFHSFVGE